MTLQKKSAAATPALVPSSPSATDAPAESSTTPPPDASTRKVRYALVGLGHIAQIAVAPGFAQCKNAELVALVSGDKKKRDLLKKNLGLKKAWSYDEFDQCLADPEIDAIYCALPNDLHADCVIRSAAAKKHILCEKPLATTSRDARRMLEAATQNEVKLMTAYRLHFEPATLATLELTRSGKLGEVRYFTSSFSYQISDPSNIRLQYERGGGPLYDIGLYCLNAARQLMEDEPVEVSATLARTPDKRFDEVEETAAVILRFPRGRLASFTVSFGAAPASRVELVGTKGKVVLEPAFEYSEALRQTVTIDEKSEEKTFPHTDQFGGEIEAFSAWVLGQREAPTAAGAEGLADVRLIEAIFAADRESRRVRMKAFDLTRWKAAAPVEKAKRKKAVKKPAPVRVNAPHD